MDICLMTYNRDTSIVDKARDVSILLVKGESKRTMRAVSKIQYPQNECMKHISVGLRSNRPRKHDVAHRQSKGRIWVSVRQSSNMGSMAHFGPLTSQMEGPVIKWPWSYITWISMRGMVTWIRCLRIFVLQYSCRRWKNFTPRWRMIDRYEHNLFIFQHFKPLVIVSVKYSNMLSVKKN